MKLIHLAVLFGFIVHDIHAQVRFFLLLVYCSFVLCFFFSIIHAYTSIIAKKKPKERKKVNETNKSSWLFFVHKSTLFCLGVRIGKKCRIFKNHIILNVEMQHTCAIIQVVPTASNFLTLDLITN